MTTIKRMCVAKVHACTHAHTHARTHACTHARTHTHTQPFYSSVGFCQGLPGWAGTRKVKSVWIY